LKLSYCETVRTKTVVMRPRTWH